jgi:hypothetical protein
MQVNWNLAEPETFIVAGVALAELSDCSAGAADTMRRRRVLLRLPMAAFVLRWHYAADLWHEAETVCLQMAALAASYLMHKQHLTCGVAGDLRQCRLLLCMAACMLRLYHAAVLQRSKPTCVKCVSANWQAWLLHNTCASST